jgi:hypothetical protein
VAVAESTVSANGIYQWQEVTANLLFATVSPIWAVGMFQQAAALGPEQALLGAAALKEASSFSNGTLG